MKFRTEGLIIKEQNIGEQDKLVFALTKSNGVIRAFVKGAKNIKNGKCAAASLLSYCLLYTSDAADDSLSSAVMLQKCALHSIFANLL